jgi:hypothetical protein
MMNCTQGDLALIVAGPIAGTLVTCLEFLPAGWWRDDLPPGIEQQIDEAVGPLWRVDRPVPCEAPFAAGGVYWVPDKFLMPIRPESGAEAIADKLASGA